MSAHYESLCSCGTGILRVYDGWRSYQHKDSFAHAVFLQPEGSTAHFKALRAERFTATHWRSLNDCLAENGFARARWERYKDGKLINVEFPVISRKEFPMSVENALAAADTALQHAIAEATKHKETALAAALTDLQAAHVAASATARAMPEDYTVAASTLFPGLAALQQVKTVGLAHPNQTHPVHASAKAAVVAVGRVIIAVVEREIARVE